MTVLVLAVVEGFEVGEGELEGGGKMGAEGSGDGRSVLSSEEGMGGPGEIDFVDGIELGQSADE